MSTIYKIYGYIYNKYTKESRQATPVVRPSNLNTQAFPPLARNRAPSPNNSPGNEIKPRPRQVSPAPGSTLSLSPPNSSLQSSNSPTNPPLRRLIPTPNIQTNLRPLRNGIRRMPRLGIPRPISPQILPKDRIPLNRLERNSFLLLPTSVFTLTLILITLQKPTPSLPHRPSQTRKIRTPTFTVRSQIHHKRAYPVTSARKRPRPVIVMPVMAGGIVALRPHALDVEMWTPALEGAGAVFQAADCIVAV